MDLKLRISNDDLAEFIALNGENESDEIPYMHVGLKMHFIDSNGVKVVKELIIGAIQYTTNSTLSKSDGNSLKELEVY